MLMWILAAVAWAVGVPPLVVAAGVVLAVNVPVGLAALVVAAFVERRAGRRAAKIDEAAFLRSVATAVSAGSTLRSAIRSGDPAVVAERTRRLCDAGVSMAKVGESLKGSLAHNGVTFAAVCSLSETTGSALSPTLHVLSQRAADGAAIRRHRGVATAQARFSAVIVGLAPLAVTVGLVATRGMPADGDPVAAWSVVFGSLLQIVGLAVVFAMASRSIAR